MQWYQELTDFSANIVLLTHGVPSVFFPVGAVFPGEGIYPPSAAFTQYTYRPISLVVTDAGSGALVGTNEMNDTITLTGLTNGEPIPFLPKLILATGTTVSKLRIAYIRPGIRVS